MLQMPAGYDEFKISLGKGTFRIIKVIKDWDSPQFREFLINIEKYLQRNQSFHDFRNVLIRIGQDETLGIKKDIVAKKFKLVRKYDHFRFRFLPSKALRSLMMAQTLNQNGLKTPSPLAVIEDRGADNQLATCYFLTEYLDYDCSFAQAIDHSDIRLKEKIITEAARNIRLMHNAGIIHNDLHASNILIKNVKAQPEFYYIDLNRARQKRELSIEKRAKDLGRLALNQSDLNLFLNYYLPESSETFLKFVEKMRRRRERWIGFKKWFRQFKTKLRR